MVAKETIMGMAGAVAIHQLVNLVPQVSKDQRVDQGIKLAIGLIAVLWSVKIKDATLKTAVLAFGIGVGSAALTPYLEQLAAPLVR